MVEEIKELYLQEKKKVKALKQALIKEMADKQHAERDTEESLRQGRDEVDRREQAEADTADLYRQNAELHKEYKELQDRNLDLYSKCQELEELTLDQSSIVQAT